MTEVTMAEITRQAVKLWVEKAATAATTPLSKVLFLIWTFPGVCNCENMEHGAEETDQTFNVYIYMRKTLLHSICSRFQT